MISGNGILKVWSIAVGVILITLGIALTLTMGYKYYSVWGMEMEGKAKLAESSQSRQIAVEQARAERDASKLRAEAISIMGKAAKDFPEYRTQEFMGSFGEALREGKISQIMYVPTEGNIPIMEANRLK